MPRAQCDASHLPAVDNVYQPSLSNSSNTQLHGCLGCGLLLATRTMCLMAYDGLLCVSLTATA